MRVAAGASAAASDRVRITRPPDGNGSCANGMNIAGIASASSPPSFVLPTTPTTVRQSPETGMNLSTSPVHATRRPIGILVREEAVGERLVEDDDTLGARSVRGRELPAAQERDA